MKKIVTLIVVLLASVQFAFSQQAIAKIKYEEAEEAYAANKFELTVTKLNEVEAILKSTNPRVMYLKIMAHYGIFKENPYKNFEVLNNTRPLCEKYLKNYESLPDNEDKYRDIYKVAEVVKDFPSDKLKYNAYGNLKINNLKKEAQGYMYAKDSIDYSKAFNCYTLLAKYGDTNAISELGRCYYNGYGVQVDYIKAFSYAKERADKGDPVAQNLLGGIYSNTESGFYNPIKSVEYFEMAANQGNVRALYNLGHANVIFLEMGDYKNPKNLHYLKLCYEFTLKNIEKGLPIYESPGDLAIIISQIYKKGLGVKKDKLEAAKWEAIAQGRISK